MTDSTNYQPNKAKNWRQQISILLISQTISMFGSMVSGFAVVWYITLKTGSGMWVTYATLANTVPSVIISLWAGVWADRYSRRKLAMMADGGIALVTLLMAILFAFDIDALWLLLILLAARSAGNGIQSPSVNALVADITPTSDLSRINGIYNTLASFSQLMAPAIGGVILANFDLNFAFWLDVITATIGISMIGTLKLKPQARIREKLGIFQEMAAGLNYVKMRPLILGLMIAYFAFFVLLAPASVLSPVFVERAYGENVMYLTWSEVAWSIGSVVGGVLVSLHKVIKDKIGAISLVMIVCGVVFGVIGFASNIVWYCVIMAIGGLVFPLLPTADTTLIQENVEPEFMGRVFSVFGIFVGATTPIGTLMFGPLADVIDIKWIFLGTGILNIVVGWLFLKKMATYRRQELAKHGVIGSKSTALSDHSDESEAE